MPEQDVRIALGPVGVAGLLALVTSLVRRSPRLAALGALAIAADASLPQLRGFAAMRAAPAQPDDIPATPSAV